MSLSRSLFNEFRPLFRMLEDPFAWQPTPALSRRHMAEPLGWHQATPALNLTEENGTYVVEAEVPGVKKENLDVRVGDGGRSLTIEGRVVQAGKQQPEGEQQQQQQQQQQQPATNKDQASTSQAVVPSNGKEDLDHPDSRTVTDVPPSDADKQVSTNTASYHSSRTFTRTVWLPHAVDKANIKARLEDGILTIHAPRTTQESFNVNVE
ncbi:HSP20-like chaperone [Serendipita vermifera]|nr:HSP20-like chaperone [Serendipita vermifera]